VLDSLVSADASHVPNIVRTEIVVKKQLISQPSILPLLRRINVHPTGVFGTHFAQDAPSFALVVLESPSSVRGSGCHFQIYNVVVLRGVRSMRSHLNFLSDHIVQCGPLIFTDTLHSPGPIFVLNLWLDHSLLELLFIPLLIMVTMDHFKGHRGRPRYTLYQINLL
jgi:hypothetical protein